MSDESNVQSESSEHEAEYSPEIREAIEVAKSFGISMYQVLDVDPAADIPVTAKRMVESTESENAE